jgi:hypothetical protein
MTIDGAIAGYAYASPHRERAAYRWAVEVTVYIHEQFRGRGLGRGAVHGAIQAPAGPGFLQGLRGDHAAQSRQPGVPRIHGLHPVGTYRKIGYKLGSWWDTSWWQIALQPEVESPAEPRPPPPPLRPMTRSDRLIPCPMFIGGEWIRPKLAGSPVYNPSIGDVISECPMGGAPR